MTKYAFAFLGMMIGAAACAQPSDAYRRAMRQQIAALDTTRSAPGYQQVANGFGRIAQRESEAWLPRYYTALAYIRQSFHYADATERDAALDRARPHVDQALALAPAESEVVLLDGFWSMARLTIDPATRGQQLTPQTMQRFGQAMQMAPDNPRAALLMGQMQYGTAQFFGSSTDEACGLLRRSAAQFKAQPADPEGIDPAWGADQARQWALRCAGK